MKNANGYSVLTYPKPSSGRKLLRRIDILVIVRIWYEIYRPHHNLL